MRDGLRWCINQGFSRQASQREVGPCNRLLAMTAYVKVFGCRPNRAEPIGLLSALQSYHGHGISTAGCLLIEVNRPSILRCGNLRF